MPFASASFSSGEVAGVDCTNCQFESHDIEIEAHSTTSVTCPNCGATFLTEAQKTQLREAGEL